MSHAGAQKPRVAEYVTPRRTCLDAQRSMVTSDMGFNSWKGVISVDYLGVQRVASCMSTSRPS